MKYEESVAAKVGISKPRAQELRRCLEMIDTTQADTFHDHDDKYGINNLEDSLIDQC